MSAESRSHPRGGTIVDNLQIQWWYHSGKISKFLPRLNQRNLTRGGLAATTLFAACGGEPTPSSVLPISVNRLEPESNPDTKLESQGILIKGRLAFTEAGSFAGGPHPHNPTDGVDKIWPGLDFGLAGGKSCDDPALKDWPVVASLAGTVVEVTDWSVVVEHPENPEQGKESLYHHIQNSPLKIGSQVKEGELIGNPSCNGIIPPPDKPDFKPAPHLHQGFRSYTTVARRRVYQDIRPEAVELSGWRFKRGDKPYSGVMSKPGEEDRVANEFYCPPGKCKSRNDLNPSEGRSVLAAPLPPKTPVTQEVTVKAATVRPTEEAKPVAAPIRTAIVPATVETNRPLTLEEEAMDHALFRWLASFNTDFGKEGTIQSSIPSALNFLRMEVTDAGRINGRLLLPSDIVRGLIKPGDDSSLLKVKWASQDHVSYTNVGPVWRSVYGEAEVRDFEVKLKSSENLSSGDKRNKVDWRGVVEIRYNARYRARIRMGREPKPALQLLDGSFSKALDESRLEDVQKVDGKWGRVKPIQGVSYPIQALAVGHLPTSLPADCPMEGPGCQIP